MLVLLAISWWGEQRFAKGYEGFVLADPGLGGWVAAASLGVEQTHLLGWFGYPLQAARVVIVGGVDLA